MFDDKTRAIINADQTEAAQDERYARQMAMAVELHEADPRLPLVSALVIAGDRLSDMRSRRWVEQGADPVTCVAFVGSYARLDFALWLLERGDIDDGWMLAELPSLWRGSDPDDTDPRFLSLWRRMYSANGGKYLRDGKPLPKRSPWLRVWRGQDTGAPFGIAWSLDRDVAARFARGAATRQTDRGGTVYDLHVPRSVVLGYLTGRGEQEVIVDVDAIFTGPYDVRDWTESEMREGWGK